MAQQPAVRRSYPGDNLDHTPGSAVTAGDVVVIGTSLICIATQDIAANAKGAVAAKGLFNVPKDDSDVSAGDALYWDADANPVDGDAGTGAFTSNSALGPFAGWATEAAGAGVGDVDMLLRSADDGSVPGSFAAMPSATVAATGTVQANAALVATGFTLVSAGDGTKGVLLPAAAAGKVCVIKNNADNVLKVWPNTSDAINAVAANTNYNMTNLSSAMFVSYDATTWYTVPLVAS